MSVSTIDPAVQAETAPPVPRRHFARWIVGGLVIVLAISGVWYVATYQPLVHGSVGLGPEYEDSKLPGPTQPHVINYIDGVTVLWGFSIRNDGPFPVTVTGVEWLGSAGPLPRVTFLVSKGDPATTGTGPGLNFLEPMHPFTLAQGQERLIVLRGVMSGCTLSTGGVGQGSRELEVNSLIVDSRAFGISHVTTIPGLVEPGLVVSVPGISVCS